MQHDAQVRAEGDRRNVSVQGLHRGRCRVPDPRRFHRSIPRVLRQVDQEQRLHVVRGAIAVLRQPSEDGQKTAAVRPEPGAVRQHGRGQKIHRR